MKPTNKFRWLQFHVSDSNSHPTATWYVQELGLMRVLQQWWEGYVPTADNQETKLIGEWRDVPIEEEK